MLAVGDKVITRNVDFTKHEGEFMGVPATGKEIEFGAIIIIRVETGEIAEQWQESDMMGWYQQLGLELKPVE